MSSKTSSIATVAFAEPTTVDIASEKDVFTRPAPDTRPSVKRSRNARGDMSGMSIWAKIAYAPYFENTTMAVIVFNAFWIGIDTEWNHATLKEDGKFPLEPVSTVIENAFCIYFTVELTVRFLAFQMKKDCFFDAWFVFDSVLVFCMILETWIMVLVEAIIGGSGGGVGPFAALRLLRLLRLARVGRLMKFVPELGKLVKGMIKAARSVIFILVFLVLVIYVFAIIFTGSMSDREKFPLTPYCSEEGDNESLHSEDCLANHEFGELGQDLFATMGDSFMSLFTRGVLGDNLDETVAAILDQSLILMWLFFIFLIITFATLLNMLIGVVCEVIGEAAAEEEENDTVNSLTETIQDAFGEIDANTDGLVSHGEWSHIKHCPRVRKSLASIGIEPERMEERLGQMAEMLFENHDSEEEEDERMKSEGMQPSSSLASLSTEASMSFASTGRNGLTVDELIQKVVDIRPDQYASALDLELLKAQVTKDQKNFKAKLKRIEAGVNKVFNPEGSNASPVSAMCKAGSMPALPGMPTLLDKNASNNGNVKPGSHTASNKKVVTLSDVPSSLLFQALRERSPTANKPARIHR